MIRKIKLFRGLLNLEPETPKTYDNIGIEQLKKKLEKISDAYGTDLKVISVSKLVNLNYNTLPIFTLGSSSPIK
jgi:hypothetical protein